MSDNLDIPHAFDRRNIVASYSMLHCFRDICAHQGQARYIDKTIKFVETAATKWGNDVHTAFEHRVGGQKPLPLAMQQWEKYAIPFDGRQALTETWFYVDINGKACDRFARNKFLHGKVDLVLVENSKAYIGDWKTGNSKYEDPFELAINAVLLQAKYPKLKHVVGQYIWLKDDRASKVYDLSDTKATWDEICSLMSTIYNYRAIGEFPKRKGPLCGWCQRWDCSDNSNPEKPA